MVFSRRFVLYSWYSNLERQAALMPDVTLIQGDRRDLLSAHPGETLLDLFGRCGVSFYAPCGGGHTCGKCRVKAAGALSAISAQEAALLGSAREADVRLACFARVEGTVTVTLQAPYRSQNRGVRRRFEHPG